MKYCCLALISSLAVASPTFAFASVEPPDDPNQEDAEVSSKSFDQCTDFQNEYRTQFGDPAVILDAPQLRILKFTSKNLHAEVACDAEEHTMTLLFTEDDNN